MDEQAAVAQQQAMYPLQQQAVQLANQSAQDEIAGKRRSLAISMIAPIQNEADPEKQAQLYATLRGMAERYDPTLKLPDAYDPMLGRALTASQIPAASQADLALKQRAMDIEQQKADQGNYEPIKGLYGETTGFMDKKRGTFVENGAAPMAAGTMPILGQDGNPVTGDGYLEAAKVSPSERALVKAIGEYRSPALTGRAATSGAGMRIMSLVEQAYPDFNANAYGAMKEWNTGKLGNTVRSLNVANDHLVTLSQYASALQNGDARALNSLSNVFKSQFGQTAPTNFEAAKRIVADEVVKAVIGAGGAVSDREEAQRVISAANSPEQLAGVIATYKQLMRGQLLGLQQQYATSTGRQDFLDRLSEKTRQEIFSEQRGGSQAVPSPAASMPKAGTVEDGYMFLGGDPADPKSWKAVK